MTRALALVLALLAGCATMDAPPPVVSTRTVEVRVPVPVPCLTVAEIPLPPAPTLVDAEHATADQIDAAAAADLLALDAYIATMRAILVRCTHGGSP